MFASELIDMVARQYGYTISHGDYEEGEERSFVSHYSLPGDDGMYVRVEYEHEGQHVTDVTVMEWEYTGWHGHSYWGWITRQYDNAASEPGGGMGYVKALAETKEQALLGQAIMQMHQRYIDYNRFNGKAV